jgi:hypothetical protein
MMRCDSGGETFSKQHQIEMEEPGAPMVTIAPIVFQESPTSRGGVRTRSSITGSKD